MRTGPLRRNRRSPANVPLTSSTCKGSCGIRTSYYGSVNIVLKRAQAFPELKFDRGLVDQHDRNVVLHRVDAMALGTLQALRVLAILERLLAGGTNQNFQQIFSNHDANIVLNLPRGAY